jgi:hypothetical protein
MRPESEKPRIPAQDSVRAYTDRTDRALKHPDPATGKPIPEPESVDAVEIEEMARDNRTRFELMKAEERTNQQWQAALEGLGRGDARGDGGGTRYRRDDSLRGLPPHLEVRPDFLEASVSP